MIFNKNIISNNPNPNLEKREFFELFFRQNYNRLFYFAFKFLGDKPKAEDVVHDVFVNLWNQKEGYHDVSKAKSYVYTAIRNSCFNIIKHQKVEQKYASTLSNEPELEEFGLELIIRSEVLGQIHQAIENLPEGCKKILKLSYFDSMKNDEIANHLGISINTVKTQKARALQLLRGKLDPSLYLLFIFILHYKR